MISLTGDWVSASEARDLGLVEEVVDPESLAEFATDLANRIALGPARSP